MTGSQILEVLESILGEQPRWYEKLWRFVKGAVARRPPSLSSGE
jgi:hypothetical protein